MNGSIHCKTIKTAIRLPFRPPGFINPAEKKKHVFRFQDFHDSQLVLLSACVHTLYPLTRIISSLIDTDKYLIDINNFIKFKFTK